MSTVFWSALGAALGGFIGVVLFFLVRLKVERLRTAPEDIRTYLCGNDLNQGQPEESEGELMHHHGRRVYDSTELEKLSASQPIWEWNRTPVGRGSGVSTLYGPYSTDFPEPGQYSATFRIKGTGFSRPDDIINNVILLELDVNRTVPEYSATNQGPVVYHAQYKIAREYVRVSELAQGGWQEFELKFYSDAQGVWEYRVLAFDGLDGKPDNIGRFGQEVRILFDTVTIRKLKRFSLPPA